jgi:hypothetical protein
MIFLAELPKLSSENLGAPYEEGDRLPWLAFKVFVDLAARAAGDWFDEPDFDVLGRTNTEVLRLWWERGALEAAWRALVGRADLHRNPEIQAEYGRAYTALFAHDDKIMVARPASIEDVKFQAIVAMLHADDFDFHEDYAYALVASILRLDPQRAAGACRVAK